jgi:amino acid transporter
MIVAVLGGTLASLLAAIVSAGRISFAMGRDRTFPRWFAAVNPSGAPRGTPSSCSAC